MFGGVGLMRDYKKTVLKAEAALHVMFIWNVERDADLKRLDWVLRKTNAMMLRAKGLA